MISECFWSSLICVPVFCKAHMWEAMQLLNKIKRLRRDKLLVQSSRVLKKEKNDRNVHTRFEFISLDLWPGCLPTTNCHLNTSASDNLGNTWPVLYLQEREATVLEQIISYEHLMTQSGGGVEHCWALPQENTVEVHFQYFSLLCRGICWEYKRLFTKYKTTFFWGVL